MRRLFLCFTRPDAARRAGTAAPQRTDPAVERQGPAAAGLVEAAPLRARLEAALLLQRQRGKLIQSTRTFFKRSTELLLGGVERRVLSRFYYFPIVNGTGAGASAGASAGSRSSSLFSLSDLGAWRGRDAADALPVAARRRRCFPAVGVYNKVSSQRRGTRLPDLARFVARDAHPAAARFIFESPLWGRLFGPRPPLSRLA